MEGLPTLAPCFQRQQNELPTQHTTPSQKKQCGLAPLHPPYLPGFNAGSAAMPSSPAPGVPAAGGSGGRLASAEGGSSSAWHFFSTFSPTTREIICETGRATHKGRQRGLVRWHDPAMQH